MKQSVRWAAMFALMLLSAACVAQEKTTLSYKAKSGQVVRYKESGTITLDAGGMKITFESTETAKQTYTEVAANGNITVEEETESSETVVNGQKVPDEEDRGKTTVTYQPNGALVAYKNSKGDERDKEHLGVRLYVASTVVFPATAVGPGDKWSHETKGDAALGTRNGKADYEVIGADKVGGVDVLKIKLTYQETEGSPALSVKGTVSVEKSSGDGVASELEYENIPFGDKTTGSGKFTAERTGGSPLGDATKPATPGEKKPETKPEPKKEKTIDEIVKDHEKLPGLFTLYRKKESGRETIYAEVKEDQLDKFMLLQATFSTGNTDQAKAGEPISDTVFKLIKNEDRLFLIVPNTSIRANEGTPLARAVRRSIADAILETFKIEALQPERKSLLINISDLFRGDIAAISSYFTNPFAGMSGLRGGLNYSLDREKTFISALKNFPENLVVETAYHYMGGRAVPHSGFDTPSVQADLRSIPFKVVYNVFALPTNNGYRPRLADPRVGYFTSDYMDVSNDSVADTTVRLIQRWHVEKADPKAKMSPPKKPIVFWLDNAIPLEYREAVSQGILNWNKAFERIGIQGAIEVKQMPDNADWDHADMRYNVVRWVTGVPYAVALFRANPLTGQILNASIAMDEGFTRVSKLERKEIVNPASYFAEPKPPTALQPRRNGVYRTQLLCDMAQAKKDQGWFGYTALSMLSPTANALDEKTYVAAFIRDVITHEMGHILGLRHNFTASTLHDDKALSSAGTVKQTGVTASVMDYTPFNIYALKNKGVDYYSSTIGPYDKWAIEYGYTDIDAKSPQGELYKLSAIASRGNEPGLAYQTDENANTFDPCVTTFDLGRDPLAYWQKEMQVARHLMFHLDERLPKKGESYYEFTRNFQMLFSLYAQGAAQSSRYIGGLLQNRNHKGDRGEKPPLVPIPAADQKRALQLLNTYLFAETAFAFPKRYYVHFTDDPNSPSPFGPSSFPVRDQMSNVQTAALRRLFSSSTLNRVLNNEYKEADGSKALTLPYLYASVGAAVWSELDSRKNVDTLRRQLQRAHLDLMLSQFLGTAGGPDDARMLAWNQLTQLKTKLQAARRRNQSDDYTRIHLDETLMRVTRALDAQQTVGGSAAPGRSISLLELLGGSVSPDGNTDTPR